MALGSPWKSIPRGKSGLPISELFPELSRHADRLCVLRSMHSESPIHASANYWMNTGWGQPGRPSVGSGVHYGMGSEADNLPGFVVLNGGLLPIGGLDNFKPGFLPARVSPSLFDRTDPALPNVKPANPDRQAARLKKIAEFDRGFADANGKADMLEAAIRSYELAAKMQLAAPEALDLSKETKETLKL